MAAAIGIRMGSAKEATVPQVRIEDTTDWVQAGWADFKKAPIISTFSGGAYVLVGYAIVLWLQSVGLSSFLLPVMSGFMIVAPLFAVLFYEIARMQAEGAEIDYGAAVKSSFTNIGQLAIVGFVLMLVMMVWLMLAMVIFSVFFGGTPPGLEGFYESLISQPQTPAFLIVGTAVGGVLAAIAFAVSAISMPMIVSENISAFDAMAFSIAAVTSNPRVMISWAAVLVLLTGCGMATFFIGLAVTLPVAGYASWHAYKSFRPNGNA